MSSGRLAGALGLHQLVCWGVSYYAIAVFAAPIAAEAGWALTTVHGGFSVAIVVMGLVSGRVGQAVDRLGGRRVLLAGTGLLAAGLVALAASRGLASYYAAWALLGLAMRLSLYDAAFAALAQAEGREAGRAMTQVTLLGGLASSALWPVGEALATRFGWRGALLCYAGLALAAAPLVLALPSRRAVADEADRSTSPPLAATASRRLAAGVLYGLGLTLASFANSGISAHQIAVLAGLGLTSGAAVWIATLRGVSQSGARVLLLVLWRRPDPLGLGVLAAALAALGFAFGLGAGASIAAALAFSALFGAGNGLGTIVKGTQPLVLFDPRFYGAIAGRLATPSFFAAAAAPVAYAAVLERHGAGAALTVSLAASAGALACSVALWLLFRPVRP